MVVKMSQMRQGDQSRIFKNVWLGGAMLLLFTEMRTQGGIRLRSW